MVNEIFVFINKKVFRSVLDKFQALIQLKDPNAAAQTKLVSFNVRNQDHTDQRAGKGKKKLPCDGLYYR